METEFIRRGETLSLTITAQDGDEQPISLDGYTAACRICVNRVGGNKAADIPLTIENDEATGSYDTSELEPNDYYYDIRFTDDAGNDYYSQSVKLVILATNTPSS